MNTAVPTPAVFADQIKVVQQHSENTAAYTAILCDCIERSPEYKALYGRPHTFYEQVKFAAYLHDIGKNDIDRKILNKPEKLSYAEYEYIKTHTTKGIQRFQQILAPYFPDDFAEVIHSVILSHHEKYNGCGYPCQLRGEDIPLAARIVTLADVFSALTESRVYNCNRAAYTASQALSVMESEVPLKYDTLLFGIFRSAMPQLSLHLEKLRSNAFEPGDNGLPPLNHPASQILYYTIESLA